MDQAYFVKFFLVGF